MPGKEKSCLRHSKLELETEVAYLQSKISSSCSADFPNDMKFHYWTKDSHTLINKVANLELQATNEKLIEESKTLQTTNDKLRM